MKGALWVSAFRPLHLLGALYAPLVALGAGGAWGGLVDLPAAGSTLALWHGHEMIFGFSMAICLGTLLTALPSWAHAVEIRGNALALLVATWLIGRAGLWASPVLPPVLVAAADLSLYPVLIVLVLPSIFRVPDKLYRWLTPVLGWIVAADFAYHAGIVAGNQVLAATGLRAGVYGFMILYSIKGGILTPIFTGNALRASSRGEQAAFLPWLEALATASVALLAVLDLCSAASAWVGASALGCAAIQAWRIARWQGWKVAADPILAMMNLSFVWLVVALILHAGADLTHRIPDLTWVHAFTLGSLGMMMLGLMTRVALRHTGRALVVPGSLQIAFCAMALCVPLRVAMDLCGMDSRGAALALVFWAGSIAMYLVHFATVLLSPSLPRDPGRSSDSAARGKGSAAPRQRHG